MSTAVAVVTFVGGGVLIGHTALTSMLPLAFLALWLSFSRHRQLQPLALGVVAFAIGYLHIFGGTPEWTMYLVIVVSLLAAGADWRASRAYPVTLSPAAAS